MAELKPCPFCGGEAVITDVMAFRSDGKRVKCTTCYAGSMYVLINHPKLNLFDNSVDESTRYTAEQAEQKVTELWNRRVVDGN